MYGPLANTPWDARGSEMKLVFTSRPSRFARVIPLPFDQYRYALADVGRVRASAANTATSHPRVPNPKRFDSPRITPTLLPRRLGVLGLAVLRLSLGVRRWSFAAGAERVGGEPAVALSCELAGDVDEFVLDVSSVDVRSPDPYLRSVEIAVLALPVDVAAGDGEVQGIIGARDEAFVQTVAVEVRPADAVASPGAPVDAPVRDRDSVDGPVSFGPVEPYEAR